MSCPSPGFGSGSFGVTPWGGAISTDLRVLNVVAIKENVFRITFSEPPIFTGVLDTKDASSVKRYSVTAISTTTGMDGLPARKVLPAEISLAGGGGTEIDLTTDRPMSPYPARYLVAVNGVFSSSSGLPINSCFTSFPVYGVYRKLHTQLPELAVPGRDIANPWTLAAQLDPVPILGNAQLGIIPIDDSGDYAFDEGVISLKKRILRRLVTKKGAFIFMPSYGVGIIEKLKKLNSAAARSDVAAEAQSQIQQEPDVERCSVSFTGSKNLVRLVLVVKPTNIQPFKLMFDFPLLLKPV